MPRQVVGMEDEGVASEMLDVRERTGLEVVHTDDTIASRKKGFTEVRAEETGSARDDSGRHHA